MIEATTNLSRLIIDYSVAGIGIRNHNYHICYSFSAVVVLGGEEREEQGRVRVAVWSWWGNQEILSVEQIGTITVAQPPPPTMRGRWPPSSISCCTNKNKSSGIVQQQLAQKKFGHHVFFEYFKSSLY